MAEKLFYASINLNGNELRNAKLHLVAAAIVGAAAGATWFDTTAASAFVHNGTEAVPLDARLRTGIPIANLDTDPLARANHTGTQAASTISDLATVVKAYRLDEFAAPTAAVNVNGQVIQGVADPVADTDAANRRFVLTAVESAAAGIDAKPSVRVATDANVTLSGEQTIDDVVLEAGDRVLLLGQTDATENGPYVVAAGAWTRAEGSFTGLSEINPGAFWFVEEGTAFGKTQWRVENTGTINVGTDNIVINQFGAVVSYSAGNGLNLSGTQFSVKVAPGGGLTVDGTGVKVDTAVFARKVSASLGNGTDTSFTIPHNLGSDEVIVQLRDTVGGALVEAEVSFPDNNTVVVDVDGAAPAAGALTAIIIG